ncbi:PTS sugar transporter subunit IIA [Mycoplasma mycoides subsp. capri]|uniref:PTS sugar transporter subunit IIA n=1 Tax=Mycoplasma mycoides TaxID=2102 RepID=UPI00223EBC21|nr:PTS sugar transporter subunit IIA [Mycoplasma mycoides]UZK64429.1 PTS sugar transporter subunit IIA [Mycoplasma mycoides subsp. capri]
MNKEIFNIDHVFTDVIANSKKQAFEIIALKFYLLGFTTDKNKALKGLKKREKEGSTGFNDGIAIPHAKIKEITKPGVFVFKFKNGVEWDSIDNSLVTIAIALAIPENDSENDHLKILSSIARKLVDDDFRKDLNKANNVDQLYQLISKVEII